LVAGDGCSPLCAEETGYDCSTGTCETTCGDGEKAAGVETCEDDPPNAVIEDCIYDQESCMVCGSSCTLVPGNRIYCGDGILQPSEEACDDGLVNNSNVTADKCRTTCVLPSCGDGVVDGYGAMVLSFSSVSELNGVTRDLGYLMNNGTVYGATVVSDTNSKRTFLNFDGNDHIEVSDSPSLSLNATNFTISMWVKPNARSAMSVLENIRLEIGRICCILPLEIVWYFKLMIQQHKQRSLIVSRPIPGATLS